MEQFRLGARRVLVWIGRVEMLAATALLIGIVVMILVQVALGAGLGNPLSWEQEAGAYALVWTTFLGASLGVKYARHVTIITFVERLPARARYGLRALVFALMLWTLWQIMGELGGIMAIEGRSSTVALPVDLPRSWFFSVPLYLSAALMSLTLLLYLIEALIGMFGPRDHGLLAPVMELSE